MAATSISKSLRVLAHLLAYPTPELRQHLPELRRALADEGAAAGALVQLDQPGMLQAAQRLAQRVARHAELPGQRALAGQPAAHAQAAGGQLGADLRGDRLEGARRADGLEARGGGGIRGGSRHGRGQRIRLQHNFH